MKAYVEKNFEDLINDAICTAPLDYDDSAYDAYKEVLMAKTAKPALQYTKTLIRTVSHYNEQESESLLHVNTNVFSSSRRRT